ncbi:hypothetical protein CBR_g50771 [Chara braunii]|uniref:Reverse transcriptase domain-containing protein n=1 Tax=Chara braunii TaxID=69332 RepID=A0A388K5S8_CHABU|nr:hypothetical protein CBR_g50771 [Chara braunii]|eukprot:GBG65410.1 hypothetical protein CBR_g50771 [Chara braunii]
MGICNAPATFQRAMNMAFRNFVRKIRLAQSIINYCVIVYMDDILVYSSSYEGHVQHIQWALHALRDASFKVTLEKCQFFLTTISFLGHVVTDKRLQPEPQKVAVIRDSLVPTTITQVRAFLGLASYYRRFIKDFAAIAGPLTNLLRKDQSLIWTPECDQAFFKLKAALISVPVLIRPDPFCSHHRLAARGDFGDPCPGGIERTRECSGVTWTGTSEHPTWIENPELLIIQAWRTNMEGDLLGFLFGSVRPGRCHLIAQELIAPIVQLADDLSPDIYFQSDNSLAPYILERSLDPYLQWTACLEEPKDKDTLPSRQEYLKLYEITPHAFYPRAEEVVIDDDDEEKDDDEETLEEGSYSEHSEGELSEAEEEEEETGSEWEALPEEATRTGTEAEDPEAARKREEITTGKRQLEFASEASLHVGSDPTRDPEPPKPEDGDPAAATSSTARRRRSRSPSSSSPTRPPVRPRTDASDRPSSSDAVPPTP